MPVAETCTGSVEQSMMNLVTVGSEKPYRQRINWKEFACGWGSAFINITFTYPIYKLIFRQMLDGVSAPAAIQQLRNEGIYYLYRGMMPPMMQKTLSLSIMFGVYEEVRRPLVQKGVDPYFAKAMGGMAAGTMEAILMPFERIQTLLADSTYHKNFKNTIQAFKIVGLKYGFGEYYRGLVPILLRNGPSSVCFFVAREEAQLHLPKSNTWLQMNINEFVAGAVIGACISSLIYPFNVIKVAMQSQLGGPYQNIIVVTRHVYNERGRKLRYFYTGVHANGIRAFISWGIMNAAYENIKKLLY